MAKKSKPVKRKRAVKSTKPLTVASREVIVDEFSAVGGIPTVPQGLPSTDFSRGRHIVKELSWGEFDRHVQTLAREAGRSFRPEAVVGVVQGGIFVGGALASALQVEFFPVRVARRSRDAGRAAQVRDEMPAELAGKRVLIVDDVASTGDSIEFAFKMARAIGVKSMKSAALISRPGHFEPDFVAISSSDFFVFPWDYRDVVNDMRFDQAEQRHPVTTRGTKRPRKPKTRTSVKVC